MVVKEFSTTARFDPAPDLRSNGISPGASPMSGPKSRILTITITIALASAAAAQTLPKALPAPASQDAKMKWFRDAKFGLFIHWGLYAVPAGEWKGQLIPGLGEWI